MQKRVRIYRVTLDTNIFVRSLITPEGINAQVVDFWKQDKYVLVLSQEIIEEIIEVLLRPELINRYPYTEADVVSLVDIINRRAVIITPQISFDYCRDLEDNKFVTCAIVERVQYLVSGDNDLINDESLKKTLRGYGIRILDAVSFIREIEANFVL
ncbi:putative toxin-antitoxin system toxin component, PIN family [Candidatus Poribacteria bacterium]|nr:putative toxin-antitoxin system toxin component, PIN family [Candidatus Poribacteria bacterium]